MTTSDPRPAVWHATAEEIDETEARKHLTLKDVCDRTALRQLTVQYAMNRTGVLSGAKPMHHIMRPAYRVNGSEPRWSHEQVQAYFDTLTKRTESLNDKYGHLPVITEQEARDQQLVNLRAISRLSGFALTTLHRWADDTTFPALVAVVGSLGPQPALVRPWPAVREYLLTRRPDAELPETVGDADRSDQDDDEDEG
jgi:hypothetical protein